MAALPSAERQAFYASLSEEEARVLRYEWPFWARAAQLAPGTPGSFSPRIDWRHWLALAGRRFGKTRTGAEWVQDEIMAGRRASIALVAPTLDDAWKIMVDDPTSGLLAVARPDMRPEPIRSRRLLEWPNGALAEIHTSEEPDRLRGRFFDAYWGEELAFWKRPQETWDMLNIALSRTGPKGHPPRGFAATTPKTIDLLRQLVRDAKDPATKIVVCSGSTYENAANLDPDALDAIRRQYEGTRLGQQEIHARLLEDVEGALWRYEVIERTRRTEAPGLTRIVVAVDPSGSAKKTADEAGIVVVGIGPCACLGRVDDHAFVLQDLSGKYNPQDMGRTAVKAYHDYRANMLVAEDNFGGQMIHDLIKLIDRDVAYEAVHASRGKIIRAEPVAALYEQGRVHHVARMPELEEQLTSYAPATSTQSPGRLDALVWGITRLMIGEPVASFRDMAWRAPRRAF